MPLLLDGEGFILMEGHWRVSRKEFWVGREVLSVVKEEVVW